jgi:hypothetical protein
MASVQTGKAVVFGFPGTLTGTAFTATYIKDSGDVSADIKVDEIRDEDNELVGLVHSGETYELTLMMTPKSSTMALAKDQLSPPPMGTAITLSGFHDDSSFAFINAVWSYVGGFKVAFKKDGIASYEIKLRRSRNNDIATVITT